VLETRHRFDVDRHTPIFAPALPNWRGLTLTEINPDHAPDEQQSFHQLIAMLCDVLTPRSASAGPAERAT